MDYRQEKVTPENPIQTSSVNHSLSDESDEARSLSLNGHDLRIDSPHDSVLGDSNKEALGLSGCGVSSGGASSPQVSARGNSQLLADAGRLIGQMQLQMQELEQRESLLQEQLAQLDFEHRQLQLRRTHEQVEFEDRKKRLAESESILVEKHAQVEAAQQRVEADRIQFEREKAELEEQRATLKRDVLNELQSMRQSIESERIEVAALRQKTLDLTASLEDQHRRVEESAGQLIQEERERMWQALVAEWEERRSQFQREHDEWVAASRAEKLEIEREKAFYEAAVRNAESEFSEARRLQAAELQVMREQRVAAMAAEEEEYRQRVVALQSQLASMRNEHDVRLAAERDAISLEIEETRRHLELEAAAAKAEFAKSSEQQLAVFVAERADWERTYSAQKAELQGERAVVENRIRFQQEYLEKLRTDLEQAQNEFRHQRQIERQRIEDDAMIGWRRMKQMDLYREAIEEREKSLDRERELHMRLKRAHSTTSDLDRLTLQSERQAWERERQIQQSELRRQQDLLASHSESLESRRIRLDKLRAELEDTHRSTLEMRLAVEETWSELAQSLGQDVARQRVEQTRNALVGYCRELHDGLVEQRREHLESQSKFERMRSEFLEERQKLLDWIALRNDELSVGEERLRIACLESSQRDASWQSTRDRWLLEKAEAEHVIRKLLSELGGQHREQSDFGGVDGSEN